ncbi:MAG: oligosaccharide flippase family protein [Ignavibacteria bacterium]|nr:oligosaccharide flippase family protein [Ignavibacteria bacterium]
MKPDDIPDEEAPAGLRPDESASYRDRARKTILTQTAQVSLSNIVLQVSRFLKNVLLASLLGPYLFGLWSALQAFLIYGGNVHLGALNGMSRDLPLERGAGNTETIPVMAATALTFSLIASVPAAGIIALLAWAVTDEVPSLTILLLVPLIIVQVVLIFFQSLVRAEEKFRVMSTTIIIGAVVELGASVALVHVIGFDGVLLGLLAAHSVALLYCIFRRKGFSLRFTIDPALLRRLLRTGFPIMLGALTYSVFITIDRLTIVAIEGNEALGFYALGSLAVTAIGYLPSAVNQVMYPKFTARYGETGKAGTLAGYLRVSSIGMAHGMGLVLGIAILALPLIAILLPKFEPGIPVARILIAGAYFLSLLGSASLFLLTINRQVLFLFSLLLATLLLVSLDMTVLLFGGGIEGVAIATASAYALCSIGTMSYTVRRFLPEGPPPFGFMQMKLVVPSLLATLLILCCEAISAGGTMTTVGIRLFLFVVLYVPVSWRILRKENIW